MIIQQRAYTLTIIATGLINVLCFYDLYIFINKSVKKNVIFVSQKKIYDLNQQILGIVILKS